MERVHGVALAVILSLAKQSANAPFVNYPAHNHFDWNEKIWEKEEKHYITIYSLGTLDEDVEPVIMEPNKCLEWRWFEAKELKGLTLMEDKKMKSVLERAIYEAEILECPQ